MTCPSALALIEASVDGSSDALRAHLDGCASCRSSFDDSARLRGLMRELPASAAAEPSAADLAVLRATLLARARAASASTHKPRPLLVAAAASVTALAAAAALFVLLRGNDVPAFATRGTVHAHGAVDMVKLAAAPNEIVRLVSGLITVEVAPLRAGERFRVVTADAEVEVRGTAFDVEADGDRLQLVRVLHGVVEVRPRGAPVVVLRAGERWTRPEALPRDDVPPVVPPTSTSETKAEVQRTQPPPRAPRDHEPAPTIAPAADETPLPHMSDDEVAYAEGWAALRGEDPRAAAAAFARVSASDRADLHEDAAFWRAVCLERIKDERAAAAFTAFLSQFPTSTRAGQASVALGFILLGRGERDAAKARFAAARDDAAAAVREAAASGLAAVDAR